MRMNNKWGLDPPGIDEAVRAERKRAQRQRSSNTQQTVKKYDGRQDAQVASRRRKEAPIHKQSIEVVYVQYDGRQDALSRCAGCS